MCPSARLIKEACLKEKLDIGTQVFIAGNLLTHLHAFEGEIEGVRQGKEIEAVHRMRVASRRLRCTLPLFSDFLPQHKSQGWLEYITSISQDLGAVRDNDVKIEYLQNLSLTLPDERYKPGINRLILRLSQSNNKFKLNVINALDKIEEQKILQKLSKVLTQWEKQEGQTYLYTPALYTLAFEAISNRLNHFLSLEEYIFQPENIKEIHEMRTSAKWLRYTCEIFAPIYSNGLKTPLLSLRQTQEILGNLHDCDAWIQYLPEFMKKEEKRSLVYSGSVRSYRNLVPGFTYLLEQKQQQRLLLYQSFIEIWKQWRLENVWELLRQTIHEPFSQLAVLPENNDPSTVDPA
jgi:CHAD domain-containing protein